MTHCNDMLDQGEAKCFADDTMNCTAGALDASALNFNYRDKVYLGQFRTIRKYINFYTYQGGGTGELVACEII